jgi:cyclic pyranopterin monophosphate synthase
MPKNVSTSPRATDSGLEHPPVPSDKDIYSPVFSITVQKPSHFADDGSIFMVDVSGKAATARTARAQARVRLGSAAASALRNATLDKGDAFAAAQLAGIMAAKQTPSLIPLTHGIPLAKVDVAFSWDGDVLVIDTTAATVAQTGVEMEAMVAAAVSALTIYDMTKAVEKGITIESVRLLEKTGGKSGAWRAQ